MKNQEEKRPNPFEERTQPYAYLTLDHYGERVAKWFEELRTEYADFEVPGGSLGVEVTAESGEIGQVASDSQAQ